jgi:hypothetical protein
LKVLSRVDRAVFDSFHVCGGLSNWPFLTVCSFNTSSGWLPTHGKKSATERALTNGPSSGVSSLQGVVGTFTSCLTRGMLFISFLGSFKSILYFQGRVGSGRGGAVPVGRGVGSKCKLPGSAPPPNNPAGLSNGPFRRPAECEGLPSSFCSCEDVAGSFSANIGESIFRRLAGGASSKSEATSSIPSILIFSGCLGTSGVDACRLGVRKMPGRGGRKGGGRWASAGTYFVIAEAF